MDGDGFYCRGCDTREHDMEHFLTHQDDVNKRCFDHSSAYAKHTNQPTRYNIFLNVEKFKFKEKEKSNFYRWIEKYDKKKDIPSWHKDFTGDLLRDRDFNLEESDHEKIRGYFEKYGSPILEIFDEVYGIFKAKKRQGISVKTRFLVLRRDNFTCCLCGGTAKDGMRLEIDHKKPVARGGTSHEDNLWTLCFECNRGKGTMDILI